MLNNMYQRHGKHETAIYLFIFLQEGVEQKAQPTLECLLIRLAVIPLHRVASQKRKRREPRKPFLSRSSA